MGLSLLTSRGCLGPGVWGSGGVGSVGAGCWGLRAWGPNLGRTRRPPPSPLEPSPHSSPPFGAGRTRKAGAVRLARVRGLFPRVRQEALPPAENQFVLHFLCPGPAARPPGEAGCSGAGRAAVRADCVSQNVSPRPAAARPESRVPPAGRLGCSSGEAGGSWARPPRCPPKSRQAERGGVGGPSRARGSRPRLH